MRKTLLLTGVVSFGGYGASAFAQTLAAGVGDNFTNAQQIGTLGGTITQMAFDPNDDSHLYVTTWFGGVQRFDYSPTGAISNVTQVVPDSVAMANGTNGSYGIAFHNDPTLGSVMYLAPAQPNNGTASQGLGSIVRLTDTNGDGMWGNHASDVNQTIAENVYTASWTHQINQMAIHNDSLYVAIGSMTNDGGSVTTDPGEAAQTGAVSFIEDLTQLSGDTTTTNLAWFDIDVNDGQSLSAADITAYKSDTQAFTSTDPGKLRVFSTGYRNGYGIGTAPNGDVWVTMNQMGGSPAPEDELHRATFQSDHAFPKENDVVGDWKDPGNNHPSAVAAQGAGYFQNSQTPVSLLGSNTALTGLDFVTAPGNDFDGHVVVARHSNGGQDVVLVDPSDGSFQNLLNGQSGVRPTDVLTDPYGNLLISHSTSQIYHVTTAVPDPDPGTEVYTLGIDLATVAPVFGTTPNDPPAAGTNFNEFNTQTLDGATAAFVGTLIDLDGNNVDGVSFSVTNNMGKDSGLTGITGAGGPAPFDDVTIYADNYGAANVGNGSRADAGALAADANLVFTFSGLDDGFVYDVSGGYDHDGNDNFNTTWEADGQSATTDNSGADGYITLTGLSTDGSGNLEITVTKSVQLFVAGLTLTARTTFDPADLDMDGDVDDADFGIAFAAFTGPNNGPSSNPSADLDGDGDVDDADFGIAFAAFTGPGSASNVPEPGSLAVLGLGGLVMLQRRRRA